MISEADDFVRQLIPQHAKGLSLPKLETEHAAARHKRLQNDSATKRFRILLARKGRPRSHGRAPGVSATARLGTTAIEQ
jgi:hypothetical protein